MRSSALTPFRSIGSLLRSLAHGLPPRAARPAFVALATLLMAGPASAGPNAGGMLFVHDAGIAYTTDGGDPWPSVLPTCEGADHELPVGTPPGGAGHVWKVYAAFPLSSSPRLKALCFGAVFSPSVTVLAGSVPGLMDFELPTAGWPFLSGYGVMMSFGQVQTHHVVECYWLSGYGDSGLWSLNRHPTQVMMFVDDSFPPVEDQIMALGSIGFGEPGRTYCPDGNPLGACCLLTGTCEILTEPECDTRPGIFRGEPYGCDPDPCHVGACCCFSQGVCFVITRDECDLLDPHCYLGDLIPCDPFPCPAGVACCRGPDCILAQPWWCEQVEGGIPYPEFTSCTPDPCPPGGSCCLPDGTCRDFIEQQCDQAGGLYHPGVWCYTNPCGSAGACCLLDGSCLFVHHDGCTLQDGEWLGAGIPCTPQTCLATGACCFLDGTCLVLSSGDCATQEGRWMGPDTVCVPNPCEPSPVDGTSWGRLKQRFR